MHARRSRPAVVRRDPGHTSSHVHATHATATAETVAAAPAMRGGIISHGQSFATVRAKLQRVKSRLSAVGGAHFAHDVPNMDLRRALAHAELVSDDLVRLALLKLGENRLLASRQPIGGRGRRLRRRRRTGISSGAKVPPACTKRIADKVIARPVLRVEMNPLAPALSAPRIVLS
jgi:hypothetical protein